ncbi:MAG TPA: hypothetical protein VGK67_29200 [Myxococcales bacterium]|jgi:hypothetical protein
MDSPASEMQFDKAEPASTAASDAGAACAICSAKIVDTYFEVNGKVVCPACKGQLEQALTGGSRTKRAIKAAVFGTLVAAVGAGIWYAIRAATGYEIGLISIVIVIGVGVGVGMAVSRGSEGRGGWFYQAMAMYLTYSAVVVTYVPDVVKGFMERADKDRAAATAPAVAGSDAPKRDHTGLGAAPDLTAAPGEEAAAKEAKAEAMAAAAAAPETKNGDKEKLSGGQMLAGGAFFLLIVLAIAYAAPFLSGFENIIGILIIAFGVYEAWKLNKKAVLVVNGPLKIGTSPPPGEAGPADPGKPADG